MALSKTRIKYLTSLKIKKFRDDAGQFVIEGDKIIRDALQNRNNRIRQLIATDAWFNSTDRTMIVADELIQAEISDMQRISSFETPPPVVAVMDIQYAEPDIKFLSQTLTIGLDTVQDPGNMGTIIRTADWFGISNILCMPGCADIYNPKVIQASMGAVLNVKVHYTDIPAMLSMLKNTMQYVVAGTFMNGGALKDPMNIGKGMILFGNESRGISDTFLPFIDHRITIPPVDPGRIHVESLNVASTVAIVLSAITSKYF